MNIKKTDRAILHDEARLAERLAAQVLGWRSAPGRFITGGRSWIPRWRFSPFERLEDAFLLLDGAGESYVLSKDKCSIVLHAKVRIGGRSGEASGVQKARTITFAIARAIGIEPEVKD